MRLSHRKTQQVNVAKRILITGGAGFIGGHIAELLLMQGHQVIAIDNLATGKQENIPAGAQLVIGDVSDLVVLESIFETGIDAVMHIAGQASISLSFANPAADLNTNTLGTILCLASLSQTQGLAPLIRQFHDHLRCESAHTDSRN